VRIVDLRQVVGLFSQRGRWYDEFEDYVLSTSVGKASKTVKQGGIK
jgi:hypothetical protein